MPIRPIRVALVAFEGVSILDLSGPLEALRVASTHPSHRGKALIYRCSVVSARGGPVTTSGGVRLVTKSVTALDRQVIDTLIIPGALYVDDVCRNQELITWVRNRAPRCRRICSVCAGTFLLAAAGLLKRRRAVTHWMHCDLLAARHPEIQVEPDAIYVRDRNVWSSAGVTTGIDLALALIEQDCGREVAMHVARVLVVYLRRMGGQSQYSALLAAQADSQSDAFAELERWIAENVIADLRVERLAERAGMSPRNFARRYKEKRQRTPARAVEAIRVDAARRALEESDGRISEVARRCGFSDEEQMRCAFARHIGVTPSAYRERFGAP
jgi:transcriptional regulator GlxA family with amidase domain